MKDAGRPPSLAAAPATCTASRPPSKTALKLTPGVHVAAIEHDANCGIYRGRGCDCTPDISLHDPHGGVTVVDERGNTTRMRKQ